MVYTVGVKRRIGFLLILSAFAILSCDSSTPVDRGGPDAIEDLAVRVLSKTETILSWTSPADPPDGLGATEYEIRFSLSDLSKNWTEGTVVKTDLSPMPPGAAETLVVSNLEPNTLYSFGIRSFDKLGNQSETSNVVWAETADITPPAPVSDLAASSLSASGIQLTWTASGDDSLSGTAMRYDLRYSTNELTLENWPQATQVGTSAPLVSGSLESIDIDGLTPSTDYWFAIEVFDNGGNPSGVSNLAQAKTHRAPRAWQINVDGTGDAPTIQAGIDSSLSGDTVLVAAGEYFEQLNFNGKDIRLQGTEGAEKTFLRGNTFVGSILVFESGETRAATVSGFTFSGGTGERPIQPFGGAILCTNASPTIEFNWFSENHLDPSVASMGGAISVGAPFQTPNSAAPWIVNNHFENNSAKLGGAIVVMGGFPHFERNVFRGNRSATDGGAVFSWPLEGHPSFCENKFFENHAGDHGGGVVLSTRSPGRTSVTFTKNLLIRNTADGADVGDTGAGGAITVTSVRGTVANNTIVSGDAAGEATCNAGGILIWDGLPGLTIEHNIIALNGQCGLGCFDDIDNTLGTNLFWNNEESDLGIGNRLCPAEWTKSQIFADPLFCDPENDDYHLLPGTPAQVDGVVFGAFPILGCDQSSKMSSLSHD